ncbi:alpha-ketoacid dehydrogenase subunit beta [Thalassococcus sp. S3]|uniref:alpha-ketoacid dehydrogenase subunit beta n=1 Tax=Thalassococcus sp. S3 TaxID=2017482 RepID=UPI001023FD53|nr:transketolase C-terminal domain-containing protein [Thalassococcus sp. S3]QBF32590.1 alpha-ketoacid dehydrogenase subunit beta [Thalassococcus sp. S3]
MSRMTFQQATVAALRDEMRADRDVFLLGQDIGRFGGPLRSTAGLFDEFGADRVIDMPMSEGTIAGLAVGAAMQGKRPVVDLMFGEFLALVMQQFLDAGAMHYYSGGTQSVPMVLRVKYGIGPFHGHAYDHHSWLVGVPGVKVFAPSNPADAYAMMRAAVRDNNPVLFMEHMALYHAGKGEIDPDGAANASAGSVIVRDGSDVTLIGSALMLKRALRAARTLEADGISAEVIDLRRIYPLTLDPILASVAKTGRVVLLSEAIGRGASINDLAAILAEKAFADLSAPITRLTAPDIPTPFARELEAAYLPSEDRIADAARRLVADQA